MPSIRVMNLVVYAGLIGLSAYVIYAVSAMPKSMPGDVGSAFFPSVLGGFVIFLSLLGIVEAIRQGDAGVFQVDYFRRIVLTVLAVALFLLSWSRFGFFYGQSFVFLFGLFLYYRSPRGFGARNVALSAIVAAGITLVCYIVFYHLIYVDL